MPRCAMYFVTTMPCHNTCAFPHMHVYFFLSEDAAQTAHAAESALGEGCCFWAPVQCDVDVHDNRPIAENDVTRMEFFEAECLWEAPSSPVVGNKLMSTVTAALQEFATTVVFAQYLHSLQPYHVDYDLQYKSYFCVRLYFVLRVSEEELLV